MLYLLIYQDMYDLIHRIFMCIATRFCICIVDSDLMMRATFHAIVDY